MRSSSCVHESQRVRTAYWILIHYRPRMVGLNYPDEYPQILLSHSWAFGVREGKNGHCHLFVDSCLILHSLSRSF
jgi:hypothetical protein